MFCTNCGNKLDDNQAYCELCGTATGGGLQEFDINKEYNNLIQGKKNRKVSKTLKKITRIMVFVIITSVVFIMTYIFTDKMMKKDYSRTIMIYMVGSNLESEGKIASNELLNIDYKKTHSNNINVILIAGGSQTWHNNFVEPDRTEIYKLEPEGFTKTDTNELMNMGEADTLSYFLTYTYNNYKSDEYDLIFWDHGGAIDGNEYDELYDNDNLKLKELNSAFKNSPFKEDNKLNIISFRTCLNGTVEMANLLKNYSNYMIASEEITNGHTHDSALRFINEIKPDDSVKTYARKEIQNYENSISTICNLNQQRNIENNLCLKYTYSLIDLSKIDNINESLDSYSLEILNRLDADYNNISFERNGLYQYGKEAPAYDMVDLYSLSERVNAKSSKDLQKSIRKAVIINRTNINGSHGLSVYFPYNSNYFVKDYSEISASTNYNNLVSQFINKRISNQNGGSFSTFSIENNTKTEIEDDTIKIETKIPEDMKDQFKSARYLLYTDIGDIPINSKSLKLKNKSDNKYLVEVFDSSNLVLDNDTLKSAGKINIFKVKDTEYPNLNFYIDCEEEETTDSYSTYKHYINLDNNIDLTYMTLKVDKNHPNGFIENTYIYDKKENENFGYSKIPININDYGTISYLTGLYTIKDNKDIDINRADELYKHEYTIGKFKISKVDNINKLKLYYKIIIYDKNDNIYTSKLMQL